MELAVFFILERPEFDIGLDLRKEVGCEVGVVEKLVNCWALLTIYY